MNFVMSVPNRIIHHDHALYVNELWNWSKLNKKPYVVVLTKTKYATLKYDMWTFNYNLKEEAVTALKALGVEAVEKSLNNPDHKRGNPVTHVFGKSVGSVSKLLIPVAEEYLFKFQEVLFNEDNWVPCLEASMLMAFTDRLIGRAAILKESIERNRVVQEQTDISVNELEVLADGMPVPIKNIAMMVVNHQRKLRAQVLEGLTEIENEINNLEKELAEMEKEPQQ